MIKTARQLKDLIRNLSREKSADAQILMRNYMMERFLERISLSEYRDKFILKGGMLVAAMVGLDARSTMDLDATIKGANVNVEDIENLISSIVTVPIDDGVKFQLKSISEIMDEAEYPGYEDRSLLLLLLLFSFLHLPDHKRSSEQPELFSYRYVSAACTACRAPR